jgi:hypothetical protein
MRQAPGSKAGGAGLDDLVLQAALEGEGGRVVLAGATWQMVHYLGQVRVDGP